MIKTMNTMKNGWKRLILMLVLLPLVVFFSACGCSEEETEPQITPTDVTYTVHFFTNTEETFNIPNQILKYGSLVEKPDTPSRYGYSFVGWYIDDQFSRAWLFESDVVTKTMTLYARWDKM